MKNKIYTSLQNFFRIFKYLKPYKLDVLGVFVSLFLTSGSVLAVGQGLKSLIDNGFKNNNPEVLNTALL